MQEQITSATYRWDDWGHNAMWQVVASSASFKDAHVCHCSSEDYADTKARQIVGKTGTFEGYQDVRVAQID